MCRMPTKLLRSSEIIQQMIVVEIKVITRSLNNDDALLGDKAFRANVANISRICESAISIE